MITGRDELLGSGLANVGIPQKGESKGHDYKQQYPGFLTIVFLDDDVHSGFPLCSIRSE
jgi:hypothetical protein